MEKRVVATIAICIGILMAWMAFQEKFNPPPPPVKSAAPSPAPSPPGGAPPAAAPGPSAPQEAGAAHAGERPPEERTVVERPGLYRAVFSTWGASPVEFTLLDKRYKRTVDGKDVPIQMVHPEAGARPFLVSFSRTGAEAERSDFDLPPEAAWKLVNQSDAELVYAVEVGGVRVEKRWTFARDGYRIGLDVTVQNRGEKAVSEHLTVSVAGYQDPNVKPGGFLSFGRRFELTEGLCDANGKMHHETLDGLLKSPIAETVDVRWIGTGEPFFLSVIAFAPDEGRACRVEGAPTGRIAARAIWAQKSIAPGGRVDYPMAVFVGPKLLEQLDAVTVGGVDAKLGDAVNYTLEFVARPMVWVLKKIQAVVGNWGVAIIIITILLKLVMLYPTQKSMQSMKEMAKLKPQLDAIKTRFPDDKNRQNQETMALYKAHGVNPLGGCLPMLIQMPIYIAFYSMLSNAVELYRASFVGPISDMTAPFWPMAVVTGALMFLQQRMSPTAADPQQRAMMYMMPVMFMAFTVFLPSGLTLYILTNTILTMVHQWWMNRNDPGRRRPKQGAPKPARA